MNEFDKISNDHHSGSAEIMNSCIDLLKHYPGKGELKSIKDKNSLLENLIQFKENQKNFFIVQHFLKEIIGFLKTDNLKWQQNLSELIRKYESDWKDVNNRIAAKAHSTIDLNDKTILLHSNSSTVKSFFNYKQTHTSSIKIIQTESRPVMEGRIQAEFLAGAGCQVTLITDAAIGRYAKIADLSILGADAIYKDFFVNKCGSLLIALLCQEYEIPLYVLADSRKLWISQDLSVSSEIFHEDRKPGDEIWKEPPQNVSIQNLYFDIIPNKFVRLFIMESDCYPGKEI
jgi:translation initiation factor 2B subunit (eIF-2B alpha/beta/delta family)